MPELSTLQNPMAVDRSYSIQPERELDNPVRLQADGFVVSRVVNKISSWSSLVR